MTHSRFVLLTFCWLLPSLVWADSNEFFERQIRPLLVEKCLSCHGPKKPKGGLDLSSRAALLRGGDSGPAIVAGQPEKSLLIQAVRYLDTPRMPPKEKLADRDIDLLARWVQLGAPWPDEVPQTTLAKPTFSISEQQRRFWSFQPVRPTAPPEVRQTNWPRTPIDRFILARLEQRGLRPAKLADRRTLLRRITVDLTGLPPTLEEIEAFVNDPRPDAYERVVERLLASPAYGERWARHWLDVARYTDSFDSRGLGGEGDCAEAWRYRDWVVRAFNSDLPYDRFVRDQLAGDLEPGDRDSLTATGLLAIGNWGGGDADKEKLLTDIVDDQIDVVGKAFLGLTLSCARCHDHKFDPISTADYYALAGIFFSTHILPNVGPKTGGPPMLRVPLASRAELAQRQAHERRRAELEKQRTGLLQTARLALAKQHAARARDYLMALLDRQSTTPPTALADLARERKLSPAVLVRLDEYLQTERYKPLSTHVDTVAGNSGIHAFRGEPDCPSLTVNTTAQDKRLLTFLLPARSVSLHPGPRSGAVLAWTSPRKAVVRISGQLRDADFACGDGILWKIQLRKGDDVRELAQGGFPNGGAQAFDSAATAKQLNAVEVEAGERVELIVLPGKGYECDTTTVNLTLRAGEQVWDVSRDLVADVRQLGQGVWSAFDTDLQRTSADAETRAAWKRLLDSAGKDSEALEKLIRRLPDDRTGPFYLAAADEQEFPASVREKLLSLNNELKDLQQSLSQPLEFIHAAQEGGVPGSPHAGIHDVRIHVRGRYDRLGELVPRRFPEILAGTTPPKLTGSGRLELARWLTSPEHPLTARVFVNRLWQHHFGRGLVASSSNFGALGERPTHPELLDWLAAEFVRSGWSIKSLHRLMVTSAVYQQACDGEELTTKEDPDNLLLGRMSRRRLEAEAIRDHLLHVAGQLDRHMGGRADRDFATPRRSLYQITVRSDRSGFGPLFDVADSTQSVEKRITSTVAPQALFLLNNSFARSQAAALARRLQTSGSDETARIDLAYRLLYARPATSDEIALGQAFLKRRSWDDYAQVLLCANEFVYVD